MKRSRQANNHNETFAEQDSHSGNDSTVKAETLSCTQCDYRSLTKCSLTRHINSVHLKLKAHKCNMCEFETAYKESLTKHIGSVHLKTKGFACTLCDYEGSRKQLLTQHMNNKHVQVSVARWSRPITTKGSTTSVIIATVNM
jgi:hypothetical protein